MSSKMSGAYYNDHDKDVCAVLRELIKRGLIPDGEVDERSILDVQPVDLAGFTQCHFFAGIGGWGYALRLAGWPDDKPVWTGSPPCQPFSVAGKGLAANDPRHLGPAFVRLVRAFRPGVLFGEQVASADVFGHVAGGRKRGATGQPQWTWIDDLFLRLEAARYAAWAVDYPSASIGAPHIRQRTYFGALGLADAERDRDTAGAQPSAPHHREGGSRGWIGDEPCDGSSGIDRLGNTASGGLGEFGDAAQPGRGRHADGAGGASGGVAHSFREGLEGLGGDGHDRHEPGRERADAAGSVAARGDAGGVAIAAGEGPQGRRGHEGQAEGNQPAGTDRAGGVADADGRNAGAERQQRGGQHGFEQADGLSRPEPATGPTYGPWGNADWLYCRDERWRPAQTSTLTLADGLPGGMGHSGDLSGADSPQEKAIRLALEEIGLPLGHRSPARTSRLRGYGNAINPHQAAHFIQMSSKMMSKGSGE